ncbi:SagB family peptide dehydrogenase [Alicyclobacillus sp. SO9]|uniref:SagB family peptide dehydrogenase n=1 Tax=Alicyclobacillus sp. SO9 TaxID=2665646 RepID=UPI0018E7A0F0|nr:SagB family peptide dehydrogenase [Alicyclobacillus sp. SO9]
MNLHQFVYNLHFDVESVRAADVKVDWDDAPLPFKIYSGTEQLTLPQAWPGIANQSGFARPSQPGIFDDLGTLLWYSYGLTAIAQTYVPVQDNESAIDLVQTLRRFAPSGGGLYPSELYVYLNMDEDKRGVYHYDVERHTLSLLRTGDFDNYLQQALGGRVDFSNVTVALFVSTMFWKNFFKYHDFSYRLQGIDAGAVVGQVISSAQRLNFRSIVQFQFLDAAINHLLGLSEETETVYAVISLVHKSDGTALTRQKPQSPPVSATGLYKLLARVNPSYYIKSRRIKAYPNIVDLNRAAMYHSTEDFYPSDAEPARFELEKADSPSAQMECNPGQQAPAQGKQVQQVKLPSEPGLNYDFYRACKQRYSPGADFWFGQVSINDVATLLHEATSTVDYHSDITAHGDAGMAEGIREVAASRFVMGVCLHGVSGIEDGAYVYDRSSRTLHLCNEGDYRVRLQQGMSMHNVNLHQVPLCFHILGDVHHLKRQYGYRGHRIQHMEAGIVLQKLLLTASALGMNGHPLLDYDEALCDEIYNSSAINKTTLIQIPVGYYRPVARLEASLCLQHSVKRP